MNLSRLFLSVSIAAWSCGVTVAQEGLLPPEVSDVYITSSTFGDIVNGQMMALNDPEYWSDLSGHFYTPGFGALPDAPGLLIPSIWNPLTQAFQWDTAGSSAGTYRWEVTATNAAGSDMASLSVDIFLYDDYPVPKFNNLKFEVQSPASNGGMVMGTITATEDPYNWSELLYPSFKTQQYGPISEQVGIHEPEWDQTTQKFSWNMEGAAPGIYTWYVKARSTWGTGAGSIEVHILVPEPGAATILAIALATVVPSVWRRPIGNRPSIPN